MSSRKGRQQQEPSSSRNVYIVMIAGAAVVIALVAWALSRSFNAPVTSSHVAAPSDGMPAPAPVTATSAEEAAKAAVPRIGPEELKKRIDRGEVTVIDVRDADSYIAGHIPGSMHIPLTRVEGEVPYLPKGKPIITYCT
ncbi:MAG TPA: rhodanese-like domain-containing protein [Thermoanaerobaculia bacterium]